MAKIKDVLPADTSHTDLESAEYERLDVLPGEQQLLDVEPVPEVAVAVQPVAEVIAVPAQVSAPIAEPWNPPTVPEPVSEAPAKPSQKIAFTPATGRPPINWMLAFSCIFVSGAVATFLSLPAMLLEADGKTGLGVSLLYVAAFLGGAIFAGFFASAIRPQDRLWQPLYTGAVVGLVNGLLFALQGIAVAINASAEMPSPAFLGMAALGIILVAVIVIAACTAMGGILERLLMVLAKRMQPARHWVYETREGRRINATAPLRYPFQARFWSAARWLFLVAWVPLIWIGSKNEWGKSVIPSIILFVVCGRMARKRRVVSAQDALRQDKRAPIVYLRSFRDDGRAAAASGWANLTVGMGALVSPPFEETLAKVMQRYGPFVAIGRPGEEVADVGAARMYVSDDDWQAVVSDLLARPGSVALLQAGETAGLRWELHTAGEMLRPDQLLVFLPFAFEASDRVCDKKYGAFRSWATQCLPDAPLPEHFPERTRFFYFGRRPTWQVFTLQRQSEIPDKHPLADLLADLQRDWSLLKRKRQTPRWLLVSLLVLCVAVVFGILIFTLLAAILNGGSHQPVLGS